MKNLFVLVSLFISMGMISCSSSDSDGDLDPNYGFDTYQVRYELELSGDYEQYQRTAAVGGTNNGIDTLTIDNDNLIPSDIFGDGIWTYTTVSDIPEETEVYNFIDPITSSAMALSYNPLNFEKSNEMSVHISTYIDDELDIDTTITFSGYKSLNISAPGIIIASE